MADIDSANTRIVRAFIEANARDGLKSAIAQYAAHDLVWWTPATGEIQGQIRQLAEIIHASYDENGLRFTIKRIVADGDVVVAEYEGLGTLKNGSVYNNHFLSLFVMREGKIREVREYHETAHASAIWGPIFADAAA